MADVRSRRLIVGGLLEHFEPGFSGRITCVDVLFLVIVDKVYRSK